MAVSLCLGTMLALSMTGCSEGGGGGNQVEGEKMPVRIYTYEGQQLDSVSMDPVFKAIEDKVGVSIKFEGTTSDDYYTQLAPMINSGDLPDMFWTDPENSGGAFSRWADPKQDIIYGLDEYLIGNENRYPYLNKLVYCDQYKNILYRFDDKDDHYIIPVVETRSAWAIYYRADWLEQIGFVDEAGKARAPETLDEFEEVMMKFSGMDLFTDANGNKSGRTYGISPNTQNYFLNPLYGAFGITPDWDITEEGEVSYMYAREEYRDYLKWMHQMYVNGWIDPNYNQNTANTDREAFKKGNIGCIMTNGEGHMEWVVGQFEQAQGEGKIIVGPPPAGTGNLSKYTNCTLGVKGERGYSDWGGDYGGYAITKGTKDVYKVLDLLEYLVSPEGSVLRLYGIEGKHYTRDAEGNIIPDIDGRSSERVQHFDDITNLDGTTVPGGLHKMGSRFGYHVDWDYFEQSGGEIRIATDIASLYPKYETLVREALSYTQYLQSSRLTNVTAWPTSIDTRKAEVRKLAIEYVNKAIMGTQNLTTDWDAMLDQLNKAGYEQVKSVMRETAVSLGII